jgi:hypothetical protein
MACPGSCCIASLNLGVRRREPEGKGEAAEAGAGEAEKDNDDEDDDNDHDDKISSLEDSNGSPARPGPRPARDLR